MIRTTLKRVFFSAAATITGDENLRRLVRTVLSPIIRGIELTD